MQEAVGNGHSVGSRMYRVCIALTLLVLIGSVVNAVMLLTGSNCSIPFSDYSQLEQ